VGDAFSDTLHRGVQAVAGDESGNDRHQGRAFKDRQVAPGETFDARLLDGEIKIPVLEQTGKAAVPFVTINGADAGKGVRSDHDSGQLGGVVMMGQAVLRLTVA
nr:hypothetical protein [Tanacetum cinerariifolium]